MKLSIDSIIVRDRYRRDLGDLKSLAASIADLGLLQPVVVTPDQVLVAGQRRLEAVKSLGWAEVDVRVVDSTAEAAAALKAERDENTERKSMTAREKVLLAADLEELEKPKALERKAKAGAAAAPGRPVEKDPDGGPEVSKPSGAGETRDHVGTALGMSGRQYDRLKRIAGAEDNEDKPEHVRKAASKLLDLIDAGEISVTAAERELSQVERGGISTLLGEKPAPPPVMTKRDQIRAAAHLKNFDVLAGELLGLARSAEDIRVDYAIASGEKDRLRQAVSSAEKSMKRIRKTINAVKEGNK